MAYTSPTTINMTSEPTGLFNWLNEVTNSWFSRGFLMTIWIIFLMGYLAVNKDDYSGGFAVASYVTSVLALIGWIAGLVGGLDFGTALGVSLISTAWLLADKRQQA